MLELEAGAEGCAALAVDGHESVAWLSDALLVTPGRPRPWVVVYVVDSLRYDRTPFGHAPSEKSSMLAPAFEALARDGLVFDRAISSGMLQQHATDDAAILVTMKDCSVLGEGSTLTDT